MKIEKIRVGKGLTSRHGQAEEWEKSYYELEVSVEDSEDLEIIRANVVGLIDGWLTTSKPVKAPVKVPQLDPDKLAELPWKNYRTKQPCKPDEAGWIFANTPGAEALADLIEKQGNGVIVQIGPYKFELKFSGSERQFIGRAPVKK